MNAIPSNIDADPAAVTAPTDPDDPVVIFTAALDAYEAAHAAHCATCDALVPAEAAYFAAIPSRPPHDAPKDERDAFEATEEHLGRETGRTDALEAQDVAGDAEVAALRTLMDTRATTSALIAKKLSIAVEHEVAGTALPSLLEDLSGLEDPNEAYRDGITCAEESFARAFLKHFTKLGGSAVMDGQGTDKIWIGIPMFDYSSRGPEFDARAEMLKAQPWFSNMTEREQENHLNRERSFYTDRYEGGMRELYDFASSVPELMDAIKRFVRVVPEAGYPRPVGEA